MSAKIENIEGKVAVITGAGSGIGQALAEEMARRGARMVISDLNRERIEEVNDGIVKAGGNSTALTLDVTDYEAVKAMIDGAFAEHGRIDYLFNNAGIAVGGDASEFTIEDWRRVIDVNLYGVVNGVAAAYPLMVEQGFGHIVNTGSIEGLIPFPGTVSYVASKYAVVGLSNTLRLEGEPKGVKVSVVCPGHIKTRIFEDTKYINMDKETVIRMMTKTPGITPEQCALEILEGVRKNKAFIVITRFAKIAWLLHRLSPGLLMKKMGEMGEKFHERARIKDE